MLQLISVTMRSCGDWVKVSIHTQGSPDTYFALPTILLAPTNYIQILTIPEPMIPHSPRPLKFSTLYIGQISDVPSVPPAEAGEREVPSRPISRQPSTQNTLLPELACRRAYERSGCRRLSRQCVGHPPIPRRNGVCGGRM